MNREVCSPMSARLFVLLTAMTLGSCANAVPTTAVLDTALEWTAPVVLELEPDSLPVTRVVVNGGPGQSFLVDTGASLSLFAREAAVSSGLKVRLYDGTSTAVDSSGTSKVIDRYVAVKELRLGGLTLRNVHITINDSELLGKQGFAGIIGQDLLARLVVLFDMEGRQLHLLGQALEQSFISTYLEEKDLGDGTWVVVPLEFNPCPVLPLMVRQGASAQEFLEIDTGATTCSVPSSLIDSLGLEPIGVETFHGVSGSYDANIYHMDSFDLFGLKLTLDVHEGVLDFGLLGMDVLSELVFILDGPGEKLWLHRRGGD